MGGLGRCREVGMMMGWTSWGGGAAKPGVDWWFCGLAEGEGRRRFRGCLTGIDQVKG